jgi:hypothetical protein
MIEFDKFVLRVLGLLLVVNAWLGMGILIHIWITQ